MKGIAIMVILIGTLGGCSCGGASPAGGYEVLAGEMVIEGRGMDYTINPCMVRVENGAVIEVAIQNTGQYHSKFSITHREPDRGAQRYRPDYTILSTQKVSVKAGEVGTFRISVDARDDRPWDSWISVRKVTESTVQYELIVKVLGGRS